MKWRMSEQVDIAVDLGAVAPARPEILNLRQLVEAPAPVGNSTGKSAIDRMSAAGESRPV